MWALVSGSTWGCLHPSDFLADGAHTFRVEDTNQDAIWNFYADGIKVGTFNLSTGNGGSGQKDGVVEAVTYRRVSGDNLHASYRGLLWLNFKGNFVSWAAVNSQKITAGSDGVTDWNFCPLSGVTDGFDVKATC